MRKKVVRLGLIFLGFLVFGFALDKVIMPLYVSSVKTVEMPNLYGMKLEDAKRVIDSLNLRLESVSERSDARFPPGYVVVQNPRPGMKVKEGRRVYLTISAGEEKVVVPSVVGKSLRDAKFTFEKFGLKLGDVQYDFVPEIPEGAVASQSIPENTKVSRGTYISVTVSLGSPEGKVQVPNLIGLPFSNVERILNDAGLRLGKVTYQPSASVLPNTVVEQFPRPGFYVQKGSTVDVFVSKEMTIQEKQNY